MDYPWRRDFLQHGQSFPAKPQKAGEDEPYGSVLALVTGEVGDSNKNLNIIKAVIQKTTLYDAYFAYFTTNFQFVNTESH